MYTEYKRKYSKKILFSMISHISSLLTVQHPAYMLIRQDVELVSVQCFTQLWSLNFHALIESTSILMTRSYHKISYQTW